MAAGSVHRAAGPLRQACRAGRRTLLLELLGRPETLDAGRQPNVFQHVEQTATQITEQRARAEVEREERRQAWEAALVQARQDYIADLNRQRLDKQLTDAIRAEDLRRYATGIDQHAASLDNPDLNQQLRDWAAWVRSEADRIDPLQQPKNLAYVEPDEIRSTDLDPFMPRGMSAWRPPD